ncbi:unnamed protein product [Nyctereutes procyonoides]|uniref:(raccoon dog) hypothetical protein n=1 Tax=Nyctereutes procyonoides TaxID=34880 RepID=A0A811Z4I4_NYCPR|nr:unnamed protein product [Nyctereutes procyonoides]
MKMGISQDNWHKHHNTGGNRKPYHKKRMYKQGFHIWGDNKKNQPLSLDEGELRLGDLSTPKTLVKNCVMLIDKALYPQWYESQYAPPLGHKKGEENAKISSVLEKQCQKGKLLEVELEFYLRKRKAQKGK